MQKTSLADRERDMPRLLALFDSGASWVEIGSALGIRPETARQRGAKYGLATKKNVSREAEPLPDEIVRFDAAPSPEDEAASEDSLRLSPYVLRRIEELGIHGRRVQPEEAWQLPVFSGG